MTARALILANGAFADPAIPQLESPVRDGERLQALLQRADVFPYAVTFAPDLCIQSMREAVGSFFHDADDDELLLAFISGHGFKDASGKLYFAGTDTRKDLLKATALEARFVVECMQECRASRQLLFLDTCYSGAFARGTTYKTAAQMIAKDDFGRSEEGIDWNGRGVITASTSVQVAEEVSADGYVQSRFTRHLIASIESGQADRQRCGQILLDDVITHIRLALKAEGARQTPQFFGEKMIGKIILARNPIALQLPEDVISLLGSQGARDRAEAVDRLVVLARSDAHGVARLALERLRALEQKDDSYLVRAAAGQALSEFQSPLDDNEIENKIQTTVTMRNMVSLLLFKFYKINKSIKNNFFANRSSFFFFSMIIFFAVGMDVIRSNLPLAMEETRYAANSQPKFGTAPRQLAPQPFVGLIGSWVIKQAGLGQCADPVMRVAISDGILSVNGVNQVAITSSDTAGWMTVDGAWWRLQPNGALLVNSVKASAGATELVRCP
jgi:hypothetical protein